MTIPTKTPRAGEVSKADQEKPKEGDHLQPDAVTRASWKDYPTPWCRSREYPAPILRTWALSHPGGELWATCSCSGQLCTPGGRGGGGQLCLRWAGSLGLQHQAGRQMLGCLMGTDRQHLVYLGLFTWGEGGLQGQQCPRRLRRRLLPLHGEPRVQKAGRGSPSRSPPRSPHPAQGSPASALLPRQDLPPPATCCPGEGRSSRLSSPRPWLLPLSVGPLSLLVKTTPCPPFPSPWPC